MQEIGPKQDLNTPGGAALLKKMGSDGSLPFFAFLDAHGGPIADSNRPGGQGKSENIGHPEKPEEVAWFLTMVRKAVPKISPQESATLEHWLRNQKQ